MTTCEVPFNIANQIYKIIPDGSNPICGIFYVFYGR
jgi:hypothetical protein